MQYINNIIAQMQAVSLSELDKVELQNRIDKKFVIHSNTLPKLAACLTENYCVLSIDGNRIFSYENNYFDTPDALFYSDHHNGYTKRIKVRCRRYVESSICFFEVKTKEKVSRTNKHRVRINEMTESLSDNQLNEVKKYTRKNIAAIHLALKNNFSRITLVNNERTERVTIDLQLQFINNYTSKKLEDIVIIEVKQSKQNEPSKLLQALKKEQIRESGFSKYSYGVTLLQNDIRKNNFLELIKKVKKTQSV